MKAKLRIKEFKGGIPNGNECIKFINMNQFHPSQRSNTSEKASPSHEFRLQNYLWNLHHTEAITAIRPQIKEAIEKMFNGSSSSATDFLGYSVY